jgi:LmbE family N-acetylglucosaminyl deacetylase
MHENKLFLLGICAHRTDTIKGAGGTFAKYTRAGHKARSVALLGRKADAEQLRKAYAVLGTEYESLGFEHKELSGGGDDWEKVMKIVAVIRKYKPDVIFTHDPTDEGYGAFNHGTVGRLVTTACAYSDTVGPTKKDMLPDLPPHRVKLLLYYLSNMWTTAHLQRKPDLFLDISDTMKLKGDAWQIAQAGHEGHVVPLLKENRNAAFRMYGVVSGCYFAEAFTLPYDRLGRIALDKIPGEWLTSYRTHGEDHEELSLPEDF